MDKESQVNRCKASAHALNSSELGQIQLFFSSVHLDHQFSAVVFFSFTIYSLMFHNIHFLFFLRWCPLNANEVGRGLGRT